MQAVVVLGDVKGSRRLQRRPAVAAKVRTGLADLNRAHRAALRGAFDVQKGIDEFGGVVRPGADLGGLLLDAWERFHPIAVRFAVVRGDLDVAPAAPARRLPSVRYFDGPAFHEAAQALDRARRQERLVELRLGGDPALEALTAELANALYLHVLAWTPRQLQVVRAYRAAGNQEAVGRRLRIAQSTVSWALRRTHARAVGPGFVRLRDSLNALARGP